MPEARDSAPAGLGAGRRGRGSRLQGPPSAPLLPSLTVGICRGERVTVTRRQRVTVQRTLKLGLHLAC